MYKANPASVPRSERIIRRATCGAGDALRQCVKVTLPRSGNLWRVGGVTSSTITTLVPAVGVIIKKLSPTVCYAQFHGTTPLGLYTGLLPGQVYVVGTDGKPATVGDANYPVEGGADAFQHIGIATSDDELFVHVAEVVEGLEPSSGSRLFHQPLGGLINGVNTNFTTTLKFQGVGPARESVYYNGVLQEAGAGNDYVALESGGPGTGYDTVVFSFAPRSGDKVSIDFLPLA